MSSDLSFVEYVCEQLNAAGNISFKKMFGEYAIYCDEKVVALVCDNQFFLKPTLAARSLIDPVVEASPYPGAKPYFLISDQLENRDWMANLIQATASELPVPKPKRPKTKKAKG